MYTKVLVPLDDSRFSKAILTTLNSFLDPLKTQLTLLRVASLIDDKEGLEAEIKRDLDEWQLALREKGFNVHSRVLYGKASDEIVKLALDEGADLIAMTTHARVGLAQWMLGSVAQAVLQQATIPVIFLNPERGKF